MTTTQLRLIEWTCPRCGLTIKVRRLPVHCACGYVGSHNGNGDLQVDIWQRQARLRVCEKCDQYMPGKSHRCKLLSLGCRSTFRDELNSRAGLCPQKKWPVIDKPLDRPLFQQFYKRPSITRTNMLYHVCPIASNNVWRLNIQQMRRRLYVFTGRKIVAVARDDGLLPVEDVRREFNDDSIQYITVPNDRELREVASFLPLLEMVESTNPVEATFYAHTKGNSTKDDALGAEMWRNAMYHHLLDHANVCLDLLLSHPCVGTHKMAWEPGTYGPFPGGENRPSLWGCEWMFAGTFFWFRNSDVFGRPDWQNVPQDRYGAEAWLGKMFEMKQGATVFQPWSASEYPTPSPYDPKLYKWPIRDW